MVFKKGDNVIGNNIDRYTITKKNNGYGIVIENNNTNIRLTWIDSDNLNCGIFFVDSKYFDLKYRTWKDRYEKKEYTNTGSSIIEKCYKELLYYSRYFNGC